MNVPQMLQGLVGTVRGFEPSFHGSTETESHVGFESAAQHVQQWNLSTDLAAQSRLWRDFPDELSLPNALSMTGIVVGACVLVGLVGILAFVQWNRNKAAADRQKFQAVLKNGEAPAEATPDVEATPEAADPEIRLTDSMREIGKKRDAKAAIKPFSQTAHQVGRAIARLRGQPEPAEVEPIAQRNVIAPGTPEAKALERRSSLPPESAAQSMRVKAQDDLDFVSWFSLGRHVRQVEPAHVLGESTENHNWYAVPWLLGLAERHAILGRDHKGRFWIRHCGAEYDPVQGFIEDSALLTSILRDNVSHSVPPDSFVQLIPGDVIRVETGRSPTKREAKQGIRRVEVPLEIAVTEEGLSPLDRDLFFRVPAGVRTKPKLRRETRSLLMTIPENETISNILLDYRNGAGQALLHRVLERIKKEIHELKNTLHVQAQILAANGDAKDNPEAKLIEDGIAAMRDLGGVVQRDLHHSAPNEPDVRYVYGRDELLGSILLRLRLLRNYREDLVEAYFRVHYYEHSQSRVITEFNDFYWKRPVAARRRILDAVIRVWEGLSTEDRELFWTVQTERSAALPPAFLDQVIAHLFALEETVEEFETIDAVQMAQLLRWELNTAIYVIRFLMTHERWRDYAALIIENPREMFLVARCYQLMDNDLQLQLRRASEEDDKSDADKLPEAYLEAYMSIRLSPMLVELYPIEDEPYLHRRRKKSSGDASDSDAPLFSFYTLVNKSEKSDDSSQSRPRMIADLVAKHDRAFRDHMAIRIAKWVESGMPSLGTGLTEVGDEPSAPTQQEGRKARPAVSAGDLQLDSAPNASQIRRLDLEWKLITQCDGVIEKLDPYKENSHLAQVRVLLNQALEILERRVEQRSELTPEEEPLVDPALEFAKRSQDWPEEMEEIRLRQNLIELSEEMGIMPPSYSKIEDPNDDPYSRVTLPPALEAHAAQADERALMKKTLVSGTTGPAATVRVPGAVNPAPAELPIAAYPVVTQRIPELATPEQPVSAEPPPDRESADAAPDSDALAYLDVDLFGDD